jgi:peptide-methionine (S)-S-oxide reductase
MKTELATFGAGCFWGIQAKYDKTPGVLSSSVGFMGGKTDTPSYKDVCYTDTGHAEVVHLTFDPDVISYEQLVEMFWSMHDPTQVNRQGPDIGSQYRSAIYFHSEEQREQAEASKSEAQSRFPRPIATEITDAGPYFPAEEYHQKYLEKRGIDSCGI